MSHEWRDLLNQPRTPRKTARELLLAQAIRNVSRHIGRHVDEHHPLVKDELRQLLRDAADKAQEY